MDLLRSGAESPEFYHVSHFSRVSDTDRCSEILAKSVVCMTKHSPPKRAEERWLVGERAGSSTDWAPWLAHFFFPSCSMFANDVRKHTGCIFKSFQYYTIGREK